MSSDIQTRVFVPMNKASNIQNTWCTRKTIPRKKNHKGTAESDGVFNY